MKKIIFALLLAATSMFGLAQADWNTLGNLSTTPATHYIGTNDNFALAFRINGLQPNSERMRLTTAGFLGIGTQTPNNLLEIYGSDNVNPWGIRLINTVSV